MIDENAFGILLSWFTIEDDEYGRERSDFVERVQRFRALVRRAVVEMPLGTGVRVVDLGYAVYVEVGDGDQAQSPLAWAKQARAPRRGGLRRLLGRHSRRALDRRQRIVFFDRTPRRCRARYGFVTE